MISKCYSKTMKTRINISSMMTEFYFKFSLCSQMVMFCSATMPQETLLRLFHFRMTYLRKHYYAYVT